MAAHFISYTNLVITYVYSFIHSFLYYQQITQRINCYRWKQDCIQLWWSRKIYKNAKRIQMYKVQIHRQTDRA